MAKKSAHGKEIGQVDYLKKSLAFFTDGAILVNHGFGWKNYGTVKPGVNPVDAFNTRKAYQEKVLSERPALAAFRKELHSTAGLSKRWKLISAIEIMPTDPDGVWSEVCDDWMSDHVCASVEEIDHLCKLYLNYLDEAKALKGQEA